MRSHLGIADAGATSQYEGMQPLKYRVSPRASQLYTDRESSKVGLGGSLVLEGAVRRGRLGAQAIAGVPVTVRQVAKRSARVWQ